jgi:hypothetical protein
MAFFILPLLLARDLDIGPEVRYQSRADDKGNMTNAHVLIYLSHILLEQITCYCLHKRAKGHVLIYNDLVPPIIITSVGFHYLLFRYLKLSLQFNTL